MKKLQEDLLSFLAQGSGIEWNITDLLLEYVEKKTRSVRLSRIRRREGPPYRYHPQISLPPYQRYLSMTYKVVSRRQMEI